MAYTIDYMDLLNQINNPVPPAPVKPKVQTTPKPETPEIEPLIENDTVDEEIAEEKPVKAKKKKITILKQKRIMT